MSATTKKTLPAYALKVPDAGKEEKVEPYKVDSSHARKGLGFDFAPREKTIGDSARSVPRLVDGKA